MRGTSPAAPLCRTQPTAPTQRWWALRRALGSCARGSLMSVKRGALSADVSQHLSATAKARLPARDVLISVYTLANLPALSRLLIRYYVSGKIAIRRCDHVRFLSHLWAMCGEGRPLGF